MLRLAQHIAKKVIAAQTPSICNYSLKTYIREPLRILFCGSDTFSIASLRKLCDEKRKTSELIESIDVVCKVPKLTGRGLKTLREGRLRDFIGLGPKS